MPETFDTATILAPGREILDIFTEYVAACRVLGHHHHDLTRLHEWYDTEDGLDLRAIEGDQRALTAAAQAGEQTLRLQDKQSRLVDDGWQGGVPRWPRASTWPAIRPLQSAPSPRCTRRL